MRGDESLTLKLLPFGRASLMLDVVSLGMLLVLPVLTWSIYVARARRDYARHKRIQVATGVALLAVVIAFEVDVRLNGWQQHAVQSPYYDTWLFPFLYFHLFCAISTTLLWVYTLVSALRRMPTPSPALAGNHRQIAWVAAGFMYMTALTGWTFYWMAFVAT